MLVDLTGRLHPALVHLPIGILLLGVCFELLGTSKRFTAIRPAIKPIIFWGMLSAIAACITGLALNSGSDNEEDLVQQHQWAGIALAGLSVVLYALYHTNFKPALIKLFSLFTLILIFLTGHLGGSITHGEDFLSFNSNEGDAPPMKPIPNIQDALLYVDVVQPLLQSRCTKCHGTRKQKGDLRLDQQEFILQGGESGKTLVPGDPTESEMISRLLLPLEDDDHMPPKGKPQLTPEQIAVLKWWVSSGADFHKKVKDIKQPADIQPALLALETGKSIGKEETGIVPDEQVEPASAVTIASLVNAGVSILPVARESNYLSVSIINQTDGLDTLLTKISQVKKQLVWLRVDGMQLTEQAVATIAAFTSLRKLQLINTGLTDERLQQLKSLKELRSLNLVGTVVTVKGLLALKELKHLQNVYLFKTEITSADRDALKTAFPNTTFDFGNYSLPLLEGDTSELQF